ncbi:hypothetical protein Peur_020851 [Populus x canadensis]
MSIQETVYRRAERGNNPSQEPRDTPETHSDCIKPNQFSSTLEALTDIGFLTPPSGCLLGVASSASLNLRGCPKISLVQSQQESGLLSSSDYFNWRHSPCNFTPKLYGSELGSDSFLCNNLEDSMPETLKNTCTPGTKAVKSFSLNQKRASPKIYFTLEFIKMMAIIMVALATNDGICELWIHSKKLLTSSALVPKKSGMMVLDFNPFFTLVWIGNKFWRVHAITVVT